VALLCHVTRRESIKLACILFFAKVTTSSPCEMGRAGRMKSFVRDWKRMEENNMSSDDRQKSKCVFHFCTMLCKHHMLSAFDPK
jgi:hypothetical protein